MHGDDVETKVQVLPKLVFLNALLELAVGGGDDAHVDIDRAVAADALEFAFLQHA